MTCQARRMPDGDLHCLPCRLRWDPHEEVPPGCQDKESIHATVAGLRDSATQAANDAATETKATAEAIASLKVCNLLFDTLKINGEIGTIAPETRTVAIGIVSFVAKFNNYAAKKGQEKAGLDMFIRMLTEARDID